MAIKTVPRKLLYQHTEFQLPQQRTLEQLLRDALTRANRPIDRERDLGGDVRQVLNDHLTVRNTLCCILWHWVEGRDQIVFDKNPAAAVWNVQPVRPPSSSHGANVARHFLESMMFFGVRGNHLIAVQTQILKTPNLAQYLTWLIRDKVQNLVPKAEYLSFSPASASKLKQRGVHKANGIRIKQAMAELVLTPPPAGSRKKKDTLTKRLKSGLADSATMLLHALDVPIPQNLLLGTEAEDLELYLEIRRPHDRSSLGNRAMVELAQKVAQLGTDGYEVQLSPGSVLKGTELTLSKKINVDIPSVGGHPHPIEVFRAIDEYLDGLIMRGDV